MSHWPAIKARHLFAALLGIGWRVKRQSGGSHYVLEQEDWANVVFAYRDG